MRTTPLVPPLKCQGIKTKLVSSIEAVASARSYERWVEPFCGSCVVALNVQPKRALLCDTNVHIIRLYRDIQDLIVGPSQVKAFLTKEGSKLSAEGEPYYYEVRDRFNENPNSLDFLFLNRSCFNGVMRFNRKGRFNVPYCHKRERFAQAYVTKITNQVCHIADVLKRVDWRFEALDFRQTLERTAKGDLIYADPPYAGRHVDYFNSWSNKDEEDLASSLASSPCDFILSTWHSNQFRRNASIEQVWGGEKFNVITREHFYHVGSTEELRHPMIEALVVNFAAILSEPQSSEAKQPALFLH